MAGTIELADELIGWALSNKKKQTEVETKRRKKMRTRKVHYNEHSEGNGYPSMCGCKRVLVTKILKKVECKDCLNLLIWDSKGDRKRRLQRQLDAL